MAHLLGKKYQQQAVLLLSALLCAATAAWATSVAPSNSLSAEKTLVEPSAQRLVQRELYSQALDKLAAKDKQGFQALKNRLRDYPLSVYLDYAALKSQIRTLSDAQVRHFLQRNTDLFLAEYAQSLWLHELARRGNWKSYLQHYNAADHGGNKTHSCNAVNAQLKLAKLPKSQRLALAKQKWLVGFSQPAACDFVFQWLKAQGALNNDLLWQRTELALQKRNWALAKSLGKKLIGRPAEHYKAWLNIRRKPETILSAQYKSDQQQHRKLALYAVNRVLAKDLVEAETLWEKLQARYQFSRSDADSLNRRLAIRSAQRHYDDAFDRLQALSETAMNPKAREWRVRAALRVQNWPAALQALLGMLPEEQVKDEWVYWRGRVEHELGNAHVAQLAYQRLADKRGYYSFMAAERLGVDYAFTPDTPVANASHIYALQSQAEFQRIRELLLHKQLNYARVEWYRATRSLNQESLLAAGQLAHHWQWHEQAIRIAAKLGHYDDLDLRFAMPHRQAVEQHAKAVDIDPNWAQAIMRRESAYAADARSGVGARGLMQLMPATAKHVARKQGWKWRGTAQLNQPDVNIRYGTAYLAELSAQLDNEIPLVSAAYNAGPHRVAKWRPKSGSLPMDIWIDTIPFAETRKYVHAVSEYMSIFKWRSEGQPQMTGQTLLYTQKQVGDGLLASADKPGI